MANTISMSITFNYNNESIKNMAAEIANAVAKSLNTATDSVANMSNSLIDAVKTFNTIATSATTLQQIGGTKGDVHGLSYLYLTERKS